MTQYERLAEAKLSRQLMEARAEIERLTDLKRTCQCSEDAQCMFARERDECRKLLREVLNRAEPWENLAVYPVRLTPEWIRAAKKATGGE